MYLGFEIALGLSFGGLLNSHRVGLPFPS